MRQTRPDPEALRAKSAAAPRKIRGYADVTHETESGILGQVIAQRERLSARLASVGAVVAIASGKGGVGKSAITANLAVALASRGARVGALDADLNGPSLGRMLGLLGSTLYEAPDGILPPIGASNVVGMSTDLLLQQGAALRWKGPDSDRFVWQGVTEAAMLREFLADVSWGELDYLLVDIPPGTDKIERFLDLVPQPAQILLVTTPSQVALSVVARSAALLQRAGVASVALVANMVGYVPPGAASPLDLFSGEDVGRFAASSGLELWATIPFDADMGRRTDSGEPPGAGDATSAGPAVHGLAERVEGGPGGRDRVR